MTEQGQIDTKQIQARMDRESTNIFARLPATYAASRVQGRKLLEIGGGLSIVEWRTLWDLVEVGPLSIRDIAAIQRSDHSLVSRALPNMRDKGYVNMLRDIRDGRQIIVEITAKGRAAYERAAPIMAKRRASLEEAFSKEEIRVFASFLDRLDMFLRIPPDQMIKKELA